MSTREEFLNRVRKALGKPLGAASSPRNPNSIFSQLDSVMSPIPPDEIIDKFEAELQKLGGFAYRASSLGELESILRKILQDHDTKSIVCTRNPNLEALGMAQKVSSWGVPVTAWTGVEDGTNSFKNKAFEAQVGISGVDFVLAESGSLVITSRTEGAQLASLAPPAHVALYLRSQAKAFLEEVLAGLPVPIDPDEPLPGRSVVFITGPSRTADIEQILIRGVHGPKYVHAVLVEDSCFG